MDDALYGTRNKRGDWKPKALSEYPPVFVWPARPAAFLKWVFGYPGYLFPWNVIYAAISFLIWRFGLPQMATMKSFSIGWIAFLFVENALMVLLFFGAFHMRLYVQKAQGTSFKYNGKWLSRDNSAFLFNNQTIDNLIWTFASGVPIWTAYEVLTLWLYANGYIPSVSISAHPIYCAVLLLLIPIFRDVHFYLIHRLIHSHAPITRCISCTTTTSIRGRGRALRCIRWSICSTSRSWRSIGLFRPAPCTPSST
jgi:hypothetical protein